MTTPTASWHDAALPLHPHSLGLQLWLELGLVGAKIDLVATGDLDNYVVTVPEPTRSLLLGAGLAWLGILAALSRVRCLLPKFIRPDS